MGTFSKSLGAIGGFAASHDPDLELLRCASRPYIFTASPSPSAIASVRAALQALRSRPSCASASGPTHGGCIADWRSWATGPARSRVRSFRSCSVRRRRAWPSGKA
ncbi:aminotransferase class I/II-fold pyridoxal phosphate-dependent enzyme [Azotobacter sp. CWF10]